MNAHQQTIGIEAVGSVAESLRVMDMATVADGGGFDDRLLLVRSFATPIGTPKPRLNLLKGARVSTVSHCQQK